MKYLFPAIVLFVLFTNNGFSQQIIIKTLDDFYSKQVIERGLSQNTIPLSDIQGSPYLQQDFVPGEVLNTSNTQYAGVPLRYNIYNDEIEFQTKEKGVFCLEKSTIKSVSINNSTFIYRAYASSGKLGRAYFELLHDGTVQLLKRHQIRFEKAQPAKPYVDPVPAKFSQKNPIYYIAIEEQEAHKITNAKDLINLFPDKEKDLTNFIKNEKLKINKEEDLLKIIAHINEN